LRPWGRHEESLAAFNSGSDIQAITEVCKIHGFDINKLPADIALVIYLHFQKEYISFFDHYSELQEDYSTSEQRSARKKFGKDCFEGVGVIASLQGFGYKPHEYDFALENVSLLYVMESKVYHHREAGYQYRYGKIMEEKQRVQK